jgi:CBS domain-containing protein
MKLSDKIGAVLRRKEREVYTISAKQTVYEALQVMASKNIGALLVTSEGRLAGIISERDYARNVVLKGKSSQHTPVGEVMVTPVVFVTPSHTVDECMTIMTDFRIRHLPVMEDDQVVGLVSIGDLVKWIISEQEGTIQHLENYIAGTYPG